MKISDLERAKRLARTIVTDIVLYNRDKVKEGILNDDIFDSMAEEIEMGRKLFAERVDTTVVKPKVFDVILNDILVAKYGSEIDSDIW